jgi:glycosyltransferase involved in cell wall biosynthesis
MTKITVGLPVYNGEEQLAECLDSLLNQTFTDFLIDVYDNASTDSTPEIVAHYAAKDARVRYHRNDANIGVGPNFIRTVNAAKTEYFLWRADDDLASPDHLQRLYEKLESTPAAVLAVSRIEQFKAAEKTVEVFEYKQKWPLPSVINIIRRMFYFHPSWIYGLWRTKELQQYYNYAWKQYPITWANDCLVLLYAFLDDAVTGDNKACFTQRIGIRHALSSQQPTTQELIDTKEMLISKYLPASKNAIAIRNWNVVEKLLLNSVIEIWARKRVKAKRLKLIRLKIRHLLSS